MSVPSLRSSLTLVACCALVAVGARGDDVPRPAGPPAAAAPITSAAPDTVPWLVARQQADGSFGAGAARLPVTSFVVIALAHVPERASPEVATAVRRATRFIISHQAESGAFMEDGVDHTVLALMALTDVRDARQDAADHDRRLLSLALPLLPLERPDDVAVVRAAWAVARER